MQNQVLTPKAVNAQPRPLTRTRAQTSLKRQVIPSNPNVTAQQLKTRTVAMGSHRDSQQFLDNLENTIFPPLPELPQVPPRNYGSPSLWLRLDDPNTSTKEIFASVKKLGDKAHSRGNTYAIETLLNLSMRNDTWGFYAQGALDELMLGNMSTRYKKQITRSSLQLYKAVEKSQNAKEKPHSYTLGDIPTNVLMYASFRAEQRHDFIKHGIRAAAQKRNSKADDNALLTNFSREVTDVEIRGYLQNSKYGSKDLICADKNGDFYQGSIDVLKTKCLEKQKTVFTAVHYQGHWLTLVLKPSAKSGQVNAFLLDSNHVSYQKSFDLEEIADKLRDKLNLEDNEVKVIHHALQRNAPNGCGALSMWIMNALAKKLDSDSNLNIEAFVHKKFDSFKIMNPEKQKLMVMAYRAHGLWHLEQFYKEEPNAEEQAAA